MHIDSLYRNFVSEGLRIISENTAMREDSRVLKYNFEEWVETVSKPTEKRTADEIIDTIRDKINNLG